ncbi:SHD1 domain-containing protein [Roseiconus nitratireducens]|nr:SHD1 domain-containing protein [Roseiconus nitratireducens]
MARKVFTVLLILLTASGAARADVRTWKDTTGVYNIQAELFAFNDEHVVLRRPDGSLGMFPIEVFSDSDRDYLKSEQAQKASSANLGDKQNWKLKGDTTIVGNVVDYTKRDMIIQRRRGRVFVNDRQFTDLPPVYQDIVRQTVGQIEDVPNMDAASFDAWVLKQRGQPRTFSVEGVVMELQDGNEYVIPFVLFDPSELRLLRGGWDEWLEAHQDYESRDDESFRLQATAAAMHRQQELSNEIAMAQYNLNLIRSGITSLWEVTLYPARGNPASPRWVQVTGRDSRAATATALQQNPGFVSGPVRKIR